MTSDHIAPPKGARNEKRANNVARFPPCTDVLRDARMNVLEEYVHGGHRAALASLAAASIRLAHHVEAENLTWWAARKMLIQVACNLKLPIVFGRRAVRVAINAGPDLYNEMASAA